MPNESPGHLPNFQRGQVLRADDLNRIVRAIARRITGQDGIRVRTFGGDVVISYTKERTPPTVLRQLIVTVAGPEYLTCRTYDAQENTGPGDIFVMKPWTLRYNTLWTVGVAPDGKSYTYLDFNTRTYLDGSDTITEFLRPPYFVGALIYAINADVYQTAEDGKSIRLIDANVGGRAFIEDVPIAAP